MELSKTIPIPPAEPAPPGARLVSLVSPLLLVLFFAASFLTYRASLRAPRPVSGVLLGQSEVGQLDEAALTAAIHRESRRFLDGTLHLRLGKSSLTATRAEVGAEVDVALTRKQVVGLGKTGTFLRDLSDRIKARRGKLRLLLAVRLNRDKALEYFTELKEQVDRLPSPPKLDLERGKVQPGQAGYLLRVYDCLAATELALRRGLDDIPLELTRLSPGDDRLEGLDISHVLGEFSTAYSLQEKDKDRGYNLKVGASKLDGRILGPGESLSFNEVVGDRTEAQGYRIAPVLNEGEVVDGMAGGSCQLSSTLFAASFFAGLDLVNSRPHTRPSGYIKMGLDATVVYPAIDMVLKNPYPFPVVIHFKVNQGKVQVRILGRKRPWKRVVFEREVKETIPFKEVVRDDPTIPSGRQVYSQRGVPGFRIVRKRLFYKDSKEPQKIESRDLSYPPTTQYLLRGTGPKNPAWTPPDEHEPFGEVPPMFSMEQ